MVAGISAPGLRPCTRGCTVVVVESNPYPIAEEAPAMQTPIGSTVRYGDREGLVLARIADRVLVRLPLAGRYTIDRILHVAFLEQAGPRLGGSVVAASRLGR